MAPLRRYLRISRYSVLEVRIYLDTPADLHRWLLRSPSPMLPRIISAVRPLVLPKLQEENAAQQQGASKKGGKRKRGWKDTVVEEEFEVAVFLTETSSRHSILRKEKRLKNEKGRLGTVGGKMTGGSRDTPVEVVEVDKEDAAAASPDLRREGSEEGSDIALADLPPASPPKQQERSEEERLFISDEEGDENARDVGRNTTIELQGEQTTIDDKEKLGLDTNYDGFSIYGRILCLVVKRKGNSKAKELGAGAGPVMMADWISSTQMGAGSMMDE